MKRGKNYADIYCTYCYSSRFYASWGRSTDHLLHKEVRANHPPTENLSSVYN